MRFDAGGKTRGADKGCPESQKHIRNGVIPKDMSVDYRRYGMLSPVSKGQRRLRRHQRRSSMREVDYSVVPRILSNMGRM